MKKNLSSSKRGRTNRRRKRMRLNVSTSCHKHRLGIKKGGGKQLIKLQKKKDKVSKDQ